MLLFFFGMLLLVWLLILMFFGFGSLIHLVMGVWHSAHPTRLTAQSGHDEIRRQALVPITTNYRQGEVGP